MKRSRPKPWASRYDRFGAAASRCTVMSWAPCDVTGRLKASARCAIFMNTRHAAAVGDVGLGEGDAAGRDQLLELVERVQVLAGGDRQAALPHDARVARRRRRGSSAPRARPARAARGRAPRGWPRPRSSACWRRPSAGSRRRGARASPAPARRPRARRGRPTFILMARKPRARLLVGLAQQRVEREVEVDAAGVARHARVEAAEQPPQRRAMAPRPQVPQRDVHGGDREHRRAAAPAVVERPPHRLPHLLDALGVAPRQERRQIPRDQRVDGGAAVRPRCRCSRRPLAVGVATRTVFSSKRSMLPCVLSDSATGSGMRKWSARISRIGMAASRADDRRAGAAAASPRLSTGSGAASVCPRAESNHGGRHVATRNRLAPHLPRRAAEGGNDRRAALDVRPRREGLRAAAGDMPSSRSPRAASARSGSARPARGPTARSCICTAGATSSARRARTATWPRPSRAPPASRASCPTTASRPSIRSPPRWTTPCPPTAG